MSAKKNRWLKKIKQCVSAEKFRMTHKVRFAQSVKKGVDFGSACSKNK